MKKEDMKIAGVVVAYNINEKELLDNLVSYIYFVDELVVVDNSDELKDLKNIERNEKIKYIKLNGNYGIAKALNVGIDYAIKNNYDFVLTMDQDSRFNNNLIDIYKKFITDDIIIYSPNYIIDRKKQKKFKSETCELYWTMTSGNLLNLKLYKKVGEFKEDFFIDGVDYEYCLRAKRLKYKILQCNKATLIHNPGITKETVWGFKYGYCSSTRIYYQIRNLLWISKEYNSLRSRLIIIYKIFKILFLFDNKREYLNLVRLGIKHFKENKLGKLENE